MKTYRVAVLPGDGTGPEVVVEAEKALDAAASRFGFKLDKTAYDLGGERYKKTGETLPDSVLEELRSFDAILLGAIGHPDVKPGILEKGILLRARFELDQYHRAGLDLAGERRVGAEQQLLTGLTSGVESTGDLGAAERAVVQVTGVIAGERHALGDTLVNDVVRHLGQAPDVRFTGAEVAALDGVVEQAVDRVTVVRIVLGSIDAALRCDRMSAASAVLVAESFDIVAKLTQ